MNRRFLIPWLLVLLGVGCATPPPPAPPEFLQDAQREMNAGTQAFRNDNYPSASAHFLQALALYASMDHPEGMLGARVNLIETALAVGNLRAAEANLDAARHTLNREGLAGYAGHLALLQARTAVQRGDLGPAKAQLEPWLDRASVSGCQTGLGLSALALRATIALDEHAPDVTDWIQRYAAALNHCLLDASPAAPLDDAPFRGRLERLQAQAAQQSGDAASADQALRRALVHYRKAAYRPGLAATLGQWGRLSMEQGQWSEAEDRLERALIIYLRMRHPNKTREVLRDLATAKEQLGKAGEAAELGQWIELLGQQDGGVWQRLYGWQGSFRLHYR